MAQDGIASKWPISVNYISRNSPKPVWQTKDVNSMPGKNKWISRAKFKFGWEYYPSGPNTLSFWSKLQVVAHTTESAFSWGWAFDATVQIKMLSEKLASHIRVPEFKPWRHSDFRFLLMHALTTAGDGSNTRCPCGWPGQICGLLSLAWPSPGYCRHLGTEREMHGSSLCFCLCAFQINLDMFKCFISLKHISCMLDPAQVWWPHYFMFC